MGREGAQGILKTPIGRLRVVAFDGRRALVDAARGVPLAHLLPDLWADAHRHRLAAVQLRARSFHVP